MPTGFDPTERKQSIFFSMTIEVFFLLRDLKDSGCGLSAFFSLTSLSLFDLCSTSLCLQMNDIVEASQTSTLELQEQIDIYKENNRRELTDLQKLLKERGQELDKCLLTTKTLQEEVQYSYVSLI